MNMIEDARTFCEFHNLPTTAGFVAFFEAEKDRWAPFCWSPHLPASPFAPFAAAAVSLESGETFRRMGMRNGGRWV